MKGESSLMNSGQIIDTTKEPLTEQEPRDGNLLLPKTYQPLSSLFFLLPCLIFNEMDIFPEEKKKRNIFHSYQSEQGCHSGTAVWVLVGWPVCSTMQHSLWRGACFCWRPFLWCIMEGVAQLPCPACRGDWNCSWGSYEVDRMLASMEISLS